MNKRCSVYDQMQSRTINKIVTYNYFETVQIVIKLSRFSTDTLPIKILFSNKYKYINIKAKNEQMKRMLHRNKYIKQITNKFQLN